MKSWLKGGLIGTGIFIVSYIFTQIWCRIQSSEFCGLLFYLVPNYIMQFIGIDYILYWFLKNISGYSFLVFSFILFFAIGTFIGFLLSKEISWKKKIFVTLIIIILISPLSIYSHHLKNKDEKIMSEYRFGADGWFISDYSVCEQLSIFTTDSLKEECRSSPLLPKEQEEARNNFILANPQMQECVEKTSKWICIQEVALELDDITICNYHVLDSAKKSCIQQIGIQRNDISLCQKPNESSTSWDEYTYGDCIIAITKNTNNISLCENIKKTDSQYDECKSYFVGNTLESCNSLVNH